MTKRIVLCADDYGQAPDISQGILSLIKYGRLTATSCIVTGSDWLEHAKWLMPLKSNIDIGLHLNLTEGKALSAPFIAKYGENLLPLKTLASKALLRQLDRAAIEAEFSAQIDRFKEGLNTLPDFLDGHQHVHQFPVIRDALINVYGHRFKRTQKPYVRSVSPSIKPAEYVTNFKKVLIAYLLGAKPFLALLNEHEIPYNSSFNGIYSFSQSGNFRDLFISFLKACDNGGIIMCHPGLQTKDTSADPIKLARYQEYQYLFGDNFLYDCHQQNVVLSRFY
jgi:predicted glycoside hydrolase/deacetylase ChbG (UPF0249 family)